MTERQKRRTFVSSNNEVLKQAKMERTAKFNLENKKVSTATAKAMDIFIYENRSTLESRELTYYSEIRYAIYAQAKRPVNQRWSMDFIIDYAFTKVYRPEVYAQRIGAASFSIEHA